MDGCERVRRVAGYGQKEAGRGGRGGGPDIRDIDKQLTFLREGRQSHRRAEAGSTIFSDYKGEEGSLLALPPLGVPEVRGHYWRDNWVVAKLGLAGREHVRLPAPPCISQEGSGCQRDHHLSGAGDTRGSPLLHTLCPCSGA